MLVWVVRYVVAPHHPLRRLWDTVCFVLLTYVGITGPFGLAGGLDGDSSTASVALVDTNLVVDALLLVDLVLRMACFATEVDGALVTDPPAFRRLFLRAGGWLDVIAALPIATIAAYTSPWYWFLRAPALLRLRAYLSHARSTTDQLERTLRTHITPFSRRCVDMLFAVAASSHFLACLFLAMHPDTDFSLSYFWAVYTVATVGYGTVPVPTDGLRILAMASQIIGSVLCNAGFAAVITAAIEESDRQVSRG